MVIDNVSKSASKIIKKILDISDPTLTHGYGGVYKGGYGGRAT
jgi:hypothetical protein